MKRNCSNPSMIKVREMDFATPLARLLKKWGGFLG
jgi:hypothetical protein